MLNFAFLFDITGSMANQLSGVKQTVANLVRSVFAGDLPDVAITIITFTEMGYAYHVTNHSFTDGEEAVAFVTSIKLSSPPGTDPTGIYGGNYHKREPEGGARRAAHTRSLRADDRVPHHRRRIAPSREPASCARSCGRSEYLKTKHGITYPGIFHVLSHVEAHFQGNLILSVVKYVKSPTAYADHRLYGAIAKQFSGVLITPKVNQPAQLAVGLVEILTRLFLSFSRSDNALEQEEEDVGGDNALASFTFFNLETIDALPTCEADVNGIEPLRLGATTDVLYALVERATVIVGNKFAKRAIQATGLQE